MGWTERCRSLLRKQEGLSTVEYVVLLVLIVGLSVGMWKNFGDDVNGALTGARTKFGNAVK